MCLLRILYNKKDMKKCLMSQGKILVRMQKALTPRLRCYYKSGWRCMSTSVSLVKDRGYVSIAGPDAKKLLQGLTTNNVQALHPGKCQAQAFLSAKGRIVADGIAYQYLKEDGTDDHIIVECHKSAAASLARMLAMYKLRSKVKISEVDYKSYVAYDSSASMQAHSQNFCATDFIIAATDPRNPQWPSHRMIQSKESTDLVSTGGAHDELKFRLLQGIADGPEILNKIPLECNLDHLNYIDFQKGCYIGQELTARTKYKGVVKKRIIPFLFGLQESSYLNISDGFDYLSTELVSAIMSTEECIVGSFGELGSDADDEKSSRLSISCGEATAAGSLIGSYIFFPSKGFGLGLGMFRLSYLTAGSNSNESLFFFSIPDISNGSVDYVRYKCKPYRPLWMTDPIHSSVFKQI